MNSSEIELPSNRKFGLFFALIFAVAFVYFSLGGQELLGEILALLSTVFFLIAVARPEILLPLNRLWMLLGFSLGAIVTPLVMGLIFFFIFTPMSLFMRLVGRDELALKVGKVQTFWKDRDDSEVPSESIKYQF